MIKLQFPYVHNNLNHVYAISEIGFKAAFSSCMTYSNTDASFSFHTQQGVIQYCLQWNMRV